MADLPKWATNEEAAATGEGDLADKLVDEAVGGGEDKPDIPEDAGPEHAPPPESGLASRALCFFRFLAVLTVLLALAVIGTNCYIIYDKFKELKGELLLAEHAVALFSTCGGVAPSPVVLSDGTAQDGVGLERWNVEACRYLLFLR